MSEGDEELERILDRKVKDAFRLNSKNTSTNVCHDNPKNIESCEPIVVTDQNFERVITSDKPVVVDFWAEWCGPCRILGPIMLQLAREYCDRIIFGKLNVDENPIITSRFEVFSIPTLLFFKRGSLRERITGLIPRRQIEKVILNLIN